jgi:hypothetical protein
MKGREESKAMLTLPVQTDSGIGGASGTEEPLAGLMCHYPLPSTR